MRDQVSVVILIICLWGFGSALGEWVTRDRLNQHMDAQDAQIQQLQETLDEMRLEMQTTESEPVKEESTEPTEDEATVPQEGDE